VTLVARLAVLFCALLAASAAAAGSRSSVVFFRTPSGNIGCVYASGLGFQTTLRCDIRSRLKPLPPKPRGCGLNWGDSYQLQATGRAIVTCHGDTAIEPGSRVLRYGTSWARASFSCVSLVRGLRCRNASDHGFFLSRQHSYRF
jgi:hypothetical protein